MVTAVALSIFGGTSYHSWLIALAVTADLHSTGQLDLLLTSLHCVRCTADWIDLRNVRSPPELAPDSGCRFAPRLRWRLWLRPARGIFTSPCNMLSLITVNSSNFSLRISPSIRPCVSSLCCASSRTHRCSFPLVLMLPVLLHPAINSRSRSRLAKRYRSVSADRRLRSSALLVQDCRQEG